MFATNALAVTVLLSVAGLLGGCLPGPGSSVPQRAEVPHPIAVMQEADRLAAADLWPGFDPREIPVVISDGERTFLFRHPSPPEGFQAVIDHTGVWTYPDRHPSVMANTSIELGGVLTAAVMPFASGVPLRERAALVLHETFHVFQRTRHPGWSANEADAFVYPVDDAALLSLRRSETEALRRAIDTGDVQQSVCWTRTAMDLRRERFTHLPAASAMYERQSELNEGLATYVEYRATGNDGSGMLPAEGFAAEAVRQRAYRTGAVLALLLDRVSAGWRSTLAQSDSASLDGLLAHAVSVRPAGVHACAFTASETARMQAAAVADVEALRSRRVERRREFLANSGWRIVVIAGSTPLFPQGFDPLNVQVVTPNEVLHTRFLKLGNDRGSVEILGRSSLTEAAGAHPLFNGVRTLTITGSTAEPTVTQRDGITTISTEGVRAELRDASVERDGQLLTITIR